MQAGANEGGYSQFPYAHEARENIQAAGLVQELETSKKRGIVQELREEALQSSK